jgi:glycosyltransferase involved in cell wall biosynthesis
VYYPRVIALITAYNAEGFIIKTLETVAAQTYLNFEVILCDDCSTDDTLKLCDEFAKTHPNFTIIKNKINLGWFSNSEKLWELGIEKGEYCFLHPHDDLLFPDFISEQIAYLLQNDNAVLAIPGMENIFHNRTVTSNFNEISNISNPVEQALLLAKRENFGWWAAYHGIHKSSAVRKILPVAKLRFGPPEFSADLIWLIKLSFQGKFVSTSKTLFQKIYHTKSLSASWDQKNGFNQAALYFSIIELVIRSPLTRAQKRKLITLLFKLLLQKVKNRLRSI